MPHDDDEIGGPGMEEGGKRLSLEPMPSSPIHIHSLTNDEAAVIRHRVSDLQDVRLA